MSVSEEGNGAIASSDSFWEIGQYKKTVKRIEDGLDLCQDLMRLIKEREEIEAAYAKSLQTWSKKWSEQIEKGPAYGTTKAAWRGVLDEAESLSDVHLRVRDRLHDEAYSTIKIWAKENYHKNTFGTIKEGKETEDAFKKAQKPWAKLYNKVDKAKKDYFQACRQERTAINQDKNAQADTSISPDQQKKLAEKADKCREEREKAQDEYKKACDELNDNNAKYMEDMRQVFERCQDMEGKRLKFFKEMLYNVHKCLDLSNDTQVKSIYATFAKTIDPANAEQDLKWWSQNHGIGMAMNWPTFEEYTPELKPISKKEIKSGDGIVLVGQKPAVISPPAALNVNNHTASHAHSPVIQKASEPAGASTANAGAPAPSSDPAIKARSGARQHQAQAMSTSEANPYEDDWDTLVDNGQPGQPVRALYDYTGQEEDELTLKKGDLFEKLEDEDEQGWCKGRKDGRIGLYPANYAEAVN